MPHDDTADVVAIQRLQAAYADVITRRAWAELSDLFLPDTEVHLDLVTSASRTIVGPDAFVAFVAPAIERFDHFEFAMLNAVVDIGIDGRRDEAAGRVFMCEIRHSGAGGWQPAFGVYEDDYRRVDGRWRFAARRYRSMARGGTDGAVFPLPGGFGRRFDPPT